MRKPNSDFDKICNFINNINLNSTYKTKDMLAFTAGFLTISKYQTVLKRLKFITHVKHGEWRVIKHVPDWFTSSHSNVVLYGDWNMQWNKTGATVNGMTKQDILNKLESNVSSEIKEKIGIVIGTPGASGIAGATGTIGAPSTKSIGAPVTKPSTVYNAPIYKKPLQDDPANRWPYKEAFEVISTSTRIIGYVVLDPKTLSKYKREDGHTLWIQNKDTSTQKLIDSNRLVYVLPTIIPSTVNKTISTFIPHPLSSNIQEIQEIKTLNDLDAYTKSLHNNFAKLFNSPPTKLTFNATDEDRISKLEDKVNKAIKYSEHVAASLDDILNFLEKTSADIIDLLKKIDKK